MLPNYSLLIWRKAIDSLYGDLNPIPLVDNFFKKLVPIISQFQHYLLDRAGHTAVWAPI